MLVVHAEVDEDDAPLGVLSVALAAATQLHSQVAVLLKEDGVLAVDVEAFHGRGHGGLPFGGPFVDGLRLAATGLARISHGPRCEGLLEPLTCGDAGGRYWA